ncbi:MAG: tetratricopeptide repeat protein [Candidatus Sulfotelmatobacter sp.]
MDEAANIAMNIRRAHLRRAVLTAIILSSFLCLGQSSPQTHSPSGTERQTQPTSDIPSRSGESAQAGDELQQGTALTRQGRFKEAVPHLVAARGGGIDTYALEFNLGLCYVGTGEYDKAISILQELRRRGHETANVDNLLAQAYVGKGQRSEALTALQRAAAISPQDEKLFAFVADACADNQEFELGLKVVELGLRSLPQSARLHYEKAVLLSQVDQFDVAKADFELARRIGQGSEIGYLAAGQEELLEGNIAEGIRIAREGISKGFQNPALLVILGKALLRSGIMPGQPEFNEAQNALEKSVAERPNDAGSQIALGQIYLLSGHLDDAIARLEAARKMRPEQPSIYAGLAKAYRQKGDSQRAEQAIAKLQSLNQAQAERIRSAPGERKMSYGEGSPSPD